MCHYHGKSQLEIMNIKPGHCAQVFKVKWLCTHAVIYLWNNMRVVFHGWQPFTLTFTCSWLSIFMENWESNDYCISRELTKMKILCTNVPIAASLRSEAQTNPTQYILWKSLLGIGKINPWWNPGPIKAILGYILVCLGNGFCG